MIFGSSDIMLAFKQNWLPRLPNHGFMVIYFHILQLTFIQHKKTSHGSTPSQQSILLLLVLMKTITSSLRHKTCQGNFKGNLIQQKHGFWKSFMYCGPLLCWGLRIGNTDIVPATCNFIAPNPGVSLTFLSSYLPSLSCLICKGEGILDTFHMYSLQHYLFVT